MAIVDLHSHTRFFHGYAGRPTWFDRFGFRLLVRFARARGIDGVAVTNHDYYERFDVDTGDLTIIPGIEISTTAGHVLLVGPDPPHRTKPTVLTPHEAVEMARDHDCAAIMPHPYRNSRIAESGADVDAVEVNGKRSVSFERLERLADELDKPLVGGSDAHYPFEVGRAFTTVEGDPITPEGIVAAIRNGRVGYGTREWYPSRIMRHAYGVIHRLKGHAPPEQEPNPPQ